MGAPAVAPRAVLDTNVVLSALLFPTGRLTWLRPAWQAGRFQPLASRDTVAELLRALAYPKFDLSPADIDTLLADFLPFVDTVEAQASAREWPGLSDPDDAVFLDLAEAGRAAFLVTGDKGLLGAPAPKGCRIVTPAVFREAL